MKVNKLYWAKYRPKNIEGMILLPRIRKELLNDDDELELNGNYLLIGPPGTGKSSLSRIIVPEGAMKVNASYNSSVEDLKGDINDYCKTADVFGTSSIGKHKIVYLDEFDGVSKQYQETLRGYIENVENHVRFIATGNNIGKFTDAIKSRFTVIDFEPKNEEEVNFLKGEYFDRCKYIIENNDINISDTQLTNLININFPDLRSVYNALQRFAKLGILNDTFNKSINVDLYDIIFNDKGTEETYNWVISNFGDNVEYVLKLCGRPLIEYILDIKKDYISKIPKLLKEVNTYQNQLQTTPDPVVLMVTCIFDIIQIINK